MSARQRKVSQSASTADRYANANPAVERKQPKPLKQGKAGPGLLLKAGITLLSLVLIAITYRPFELFGLLKQVYDPSKPATDTTGPVPVPSQAVPIPTADFSIHFKSPITEDAPRRAAIVDAFKHAWRGYERDAWGYDNYHPLSRKGTNLGEAEQGIGYMIIDVLDALMILADGAQRKDEELNEMLARAAEWVESSLDFDNGGEVNTFETTIRILGGLLSAHHLHTLHYADPTTRGWSVYLDKAIDLADRMLPSFDTPSGLPLSNTDLSKRMGRGDSDNNGWCSTAEVTTLQLEFKYLSHLTGNDVYWRKVERAMQVVRDAFPPNAPQLPPIFIDPNTGQLVPFDIRLGSRGDSYYEYLLKQYLQTNRTESVYRQMYDASMDGAHDHLFERTEQQNLLYSVEIYPHRDQNGQPAWALRRKQDHLVCFLGGSLLLGATEAHGELPPTFEGGRKARDWKSGEDLIETCMETHNTATGLSPEIAMFDKDPIQRDPTDDREWYIKGNTRGDDLLDARYILRPETVESLFIAYRLSGDSKYRDWGWKIFKAIEKHCKLDDGGYTSIRNVDKVEGDEGRTDMMETFFLGETLKYLYLLFSDTTEIPLTDYVFNTEAHPLPVFTPTISTNIV
ncbi:mannosyl-oligosaccharide alpha-1,2-mannosidase [Tulasnella sp. JGI-2019a]|nr:mannosyl-oligosaccharide alpha-1,2-mannosidase [Tulasnella sp. JGI-2019a]KAG9004222.1 mannosyl-oligosaccharide alpha-1,2-mannosidase [Tulasnella sp. JGI-2019a]KAG9031909.1 mannosyl-oligosaccharide alpha-1,2-mannosidase [Tulasnella sp. JGI-2019a]